MNASRFAPCKLLWLAMLSILVLLCAGARPAFGQSAQTQPDTSQLKPLTLPQLYWAFLSYQNRLEMIAAQREAKGQSADWIRNDLQKRLGFSDTDYAPVRTAAQTFASEMTQLSGQLKQIQAAGSSTPGTAQAITALNGQRKADLDNEIYNLSVELSPQNKERLETFMKQFFAPKKISFRAPATNGLSAGKAAQ